MGLRRKTVQRDGTVGAVTWQVSDMQPASHRLLFLCAPGLVPLLKVAVVEGVMREGEEEEGEAGRIWCCLSQCIECWLWPVGDSRPPDDRLPQPVITEVKFQFAWYLQYFQESNYSCFLKDYRIIWYPARYQGQIFLRTTCQMDWCGVLA